MAAVESLRYVYAVNTTKKEILPIPFRYTEDMGVLDFIRYSLKDSVVNLWNGFSNSDWDRTDATPLFLDTKIDLEGYLAQGYVMKEAAP